MEKLEEMEFEYNKNVITRTVGDTTLAYNQSNGDMYELNDIGAEILMYLSKEMSMNAILDKLCQDYDVVLNDIYEDVNQIISRMIELKVIEKVNKE